MTRMLTLAGALSLAVMTASGAVAAAPFGSQNAPSAPVLAQQQYRQAMPWHYEWQYHYGRKGEYVPGWVAVPNNAG
jgi:hypothetical protein